MQGEYNELDPLVDIVDGQEHARIGAIAPKSQDRCWYLKDAEVDDDHTEDGAEDLW